MLNLDQPNSTTARSVCLCSPFHIIVFFLSLGFDGALTLAKNERVYGEKFKLAQGAGITIT